MNRLRGESLYFGLWWLIVCVCGARDSEILIQVKNAFLDDPRGKLNDWVQTGDNVPCNWTGVTCKNSAVVSIDLTGFVVAGEFPAGFCRVRTLRSLILANNNLNGSVSTEALSLCSHLRHLDLSCNLFVGALPEFLPEFANLWSLNLSSNNFTGEIPASFGRFPALRTLFLVNNLLSGSIPPFLGNLSELTFFGLAYNPLKPGPLPPEIGNLTKLESLWLTETNLVGEIPESIGKLRALQNLDLSGNFLYGEIPHSIGGLSSLEKMEIYENRLTGKLPESISNLTALLCFDASENNLTGKIPETIAGLPLISFNLNDNSLEGRIPETLASNSQLIQLKLFNNRFSGELPKDLGIISDLEDFDVSGNEFTGELPRSLCHGNKLQRLIAFNNRLSGNIPEVYCECKSLSTVRIFNNELSGEVPKCFWSLPEVCHLDISNNQLEGSIPRELSNAHELKKLLISDNNFLGELPAEICGLQELIIIEAGKNQFSGKLPACMTKLKNLQILNLQENMFLGKIPSTVSSWTDLSELNLSRNKLTGHIPPDLGNLPVLTNLDLSGNSLCGEIPATLTRLKLNKFNFSDNQLRGKIPREFRNKQFISGLLDNPSLCDPDLKPFPPCPKLKPIGLFLIVSFACFTPLLLFMLVLASKAPIIRVKARRSWKRIIFRRVEFTDEEIFGSLTKEHLIAIGGSSQVFRVKLRSKQIVAVKRLLEGNRKPDSEAIFRSEVETLGRICHSNIVKLLFSCKGEELRILVYEYMENGSLGDVLHGEISGGLLDWPRRLAIAVGVAQGLAYLHHDCVPAIVHRDIKSNNVLLDAEFSPRVADFGLAKTLQQSELESQHDILCIAGSYGYIAPEYAYSSKVTEKSDVYSFGVVLMELITGKRPNDLSFGEGEDMVKWVKEIALVSQGRKNVNGGSFFQSEMAQLLDPRMNPSTCNYEEFERVLNVALLCTLPLPADRPAMRKVVEMLKGRSFALPN